MQHTGSVKSPPVKMQIKEHPQEKRQHSRQKRTRLRKMSPLVAATTLATLLYLALALQVAGSGAAVVRPTVFSDLNGPAADSAAQAANQQQQTAQQQQAQVNNQHPAMPTQADGSGQHSTKINPQKSRFCTAPSGLRLDAPLGLNSLAIDDLALSASSHSNEQVGAPFARLNLDVSGGAWCPVKPISSSNFGKEWIQVKLNRSYVITAIETQGRHWMGSGKEFTPNYQVEYSRNGGRTWHTWKDLHAAKLLRANEDTNTPVKNELSPPIVGANVIRILPFSLHLRTVCLRFELHGCPYDEGAPIAYATDDGVVEPRRHLIDYTYDGFRQRAKLSQGLGQLVDGVKGPDDSSLNNGFEWVGWKSLNGDVVVEFTFKTVRNFTGALFHSNNLFSSGVEVFQAVDVHYGVDVALAGEALRDSLVEQRRRDAAISRTGRQAQEELRPLGQNPQQTLWSSDVVSIEYEPDKKGENARPVTVHLKHRLANKLRFVLKFASKWILVSEVEFHSFPVELMSLASLSEQHTPTLLGALAGARSYDEYVAILREHQLRRIATNAFLESFAQMGPSSTGGTLEAYTQPPVDQPGDQPTPDYQDGLRSPGRPLAGAGSSLGAPSPPLGNWQDQLPASSGVLNQPALFPSGFPSDFAGAGAGLPELMLNKPPAPSPQSRTTLGLATVISLVLVAVLLLLGLLFAVSSYRLRQQPKLAAALPRRLASPAKGFMNVFGSPAHQQQQQPHLSDSHYNAIFATAQRPAPAQRAASTLKRLATMAGSGKHAHPLIGQHQQQPNQLLVSLKDSNSQLFGAQVGGQKQQAVNTQLIVGLNQLNPLAQQQIYNSSNLNCNNSNQTYATHYSTSMSMASSSTNGHAGDYADYAVPDAQPMIPPLLQPHLNHAFSGSHHSHQQPHFKQPFGYQTELRASHRGHPMHQQTLIQPQLLQRAQVEHNYELIYQDQQAAPQQHQRSLSNQLANCQQHQTLNSMTLAAGRFERRPPPAPPTCEEASPGGASNQSALTTSTSANSNSADYFYERK